MITGAKVAIAGTALLAGGTALAQIGSGDPVANWEQVAACARLGSAPERHACVDNVLRATGLLDRGREVAEQRESFGGQRRDPPPSPPPLPVQTVRPEAAPPVAPGEIERLATTVADAGFVGNRKLLVITAEGAVWRQTEGEPIRVQPRAGEAFEISRAALGGYRCKLGRSTLYRCERIERR
jgi:hypothetical protein